jgi:hypothetical protein
MLSDFSKILCYVDTSTHADNGLSHQRRAGLSIFVVNMQVQPTNYIYIKAVLQVTHSVIFAETTAIALAATVMHKLGYHQVTFLPDSL